MSTLKVFSLVCQRDVTTASACLASFVQNCKDAIELVLVSDGSLSEDGIKQLKQAVTGARILDNSKEVEGIGTALERYPHCRAYREWCPWARKLFDIPLMAGSDFAFVDSDILFLKSFRGLDGRDGDVDMSHMLSYANIYSFDMWNWWTRRFPPVISKCNSGFWFLKRAAYSLEVIETALEQGQTHKRPFLWEQTSFGVLAAHCKSGHFDPCQVAFPQTVLDAERRLKWEPVAVHFVGGTRHLIPEVQSKAAEWSADQVPVELKINPSDRLSWLGLVSDLYQHRLLVRRCRRAGICK